MYKIEFVKPVATCHQSSGGQVCFIECEPNSDNFGDRLSGFFFGNHGRSRNPIAIAADDLEGWNEHPEFSDLTVGPQKLPDGVTRYCELRQSRCSLVFTTSARWNELWHVWSVDEDSPIIAVTSRSNHRRGLGFVDPNNLGQLVPEPSDFLSPQLPAPYLPFYATDRETIERWDNKSLPFRIQKI